MKRQIDGKIPKAFFSGWFLFLTLIFNLPGGAAVEFSRVCGQKIPARRPAEAKKNAAKTPVKPLPELKLPDLDGKEWRLSENRGRVVLMNFWATWCEPCRKEMPILVKLGREFKLRGLEIVGINLDEEGVDPVKKFAADFGIDYPVLLPFPGSLLSKISPVPTTLLIDAEGRLAIKYVGAVPERLLRSDIEKLLRAPKVKGETNDK